jgi:hypothetical protein
LCLSNFFPPRSFSLASLADDLAYGKFGVAASFTVELRGDSFVNPVSDIPLSGKELSAGLIAMADAIVRGVSSASLLGLARVYLILFLI